MEKEAKKGRGNEDAVNIRKLLFRAAAAAGACILLLAFLGKRAPLPQLFIYNYSASFPVGWYVILPEKDYRMGDLVIFDLPEDARKLALERRWIKENDVLLKRIGAVENMKYEVTRGRQFVVNGKLIGCAQPVDSAWRKMPRHEGKYTVPKGEFLPVSDAENSYDGRYYGTVPIANIRCKVLPFLTLDGKEG